MPIIRQAFIKLWIFMIQSKKNYKKPSCFRKYPKEKKNILYTKQCKNHKFRISMQQQIVRCQESLVWDGYTNWINKKTNKPSNYKCWAEFSMFFKNIVQYLTNHARVSITVCHHCMSSFIIKWLNSKVTLPSWTTVQNLLFLLEFAKQ